MAKVDDTTQLDIANKLSLGVLSTNNDKNYFEETLAWSIQLTSTDVYSEAVALAFNPTQADDNVTAEPSILEKFTNYEIDEVPASNGQGYAAYAVPGNTTSTRQLDWLSPQKFGPGYAATLRQQDNTVINLTDGAFQIDYKNGLVRFDPNFRPADLSYSLPLKLTVYRYVGQRGAGASLTVTETDLSPSIPAVKELRFQPGTVSDLGSGVVEIDNAGAGGGGDVIVVEAFNVTGPTLAFTLAQSPDDATKVFLLGNGISYSEVEGHITVVGALVTWQAIDFTDFDTSDEVVITYTV